MSAAGALLFGRYAFPPNQLGYCGPPDHEALLDYVAAGHADDGLVELERRFEGAYPYLRLIADANGLADTFDERVVEAYWIGNACLDAVEAGPFHDSMRERFAARMRNDQWRWLAGKMGLNARPHHNFHVFEIYTRAGLMNDERAAVAIETMDSCRISWGKVLVVEGDRLVIERRPLVLAEGKLALGAPVATSVTSQDQGRALAGRAVPGDVVSVHWSWACERLDRARLARLEAHTARCLAMASETL